MMFNSPKEAAEHRESLRKQNPKCNWGAKWAVAEHREMFRQSELSIQNNQSRAFEGFSMIEDHRFEQWVSRLVA